MLLRESENRADQQKVDMFKEHDDDKASGQGHGLTTAVQRLLNDYRNPITDAACHTCHEVLIQFYLVIQLNILVEHIDNVFYLELKKERNRNQLEIMTSLTTLTEFILKLQFANGNLLSLKRYRKKIQLKDVAKKITFSPII